MSTTLNKLEYLDETKAQIKTALNTKFNSGITDEDTFRSYVGKIEDIYDNWTKVTGEGTDITLNNTKAAKMGVTVKGNTFQQSYNGYNLQNGVAGFSRFVVANATYTTDSTSITVSSTATTRYSGLELLSIAITNGKTYTVSMKATYDTDGLPNFRLGKGNNLAGNIIGTGTATLVDNSYYNIVCTFTADSDFTLDIMLYPSYTTNTTTHTAKFYDFQIVEGATEKPFEPYVGGKASPNTSYPQTIHNVSGNNNIKIQNKNLMLAQKIIDDSNNTSVYLTQDGFIRYVTSSIRMIIKPTIIKENTAYTFKLILKSGVTAENNIGFSAIYKDGTSESLSSNSRTNTDEFEQIFTTNSNKTLDYIRSNYTSSKEAFLKIEGSMILEGSYTIETIPTYVAHQEQNLPLTLGSIELCKIDTAQDYFYKDNGKWYLHKETGKVVFDENSTFTKWQAMSDTTRNAYRIPIDDIVSYTSASAIIKVFTTKFKAGSQYGTKIAGASVVGGTVHPKNVVFIVGTDVTASGMNALVRGEPLYYVLETPTNTEITDATLISQLETLLQAKSYNEQTNISGTSSELSPVISVSALKKGGN